eukprot:scaffold574_cov333-Pavlova_lutheri.AAC.38
MQESFSVQNKELLITQIVLDIPKLLATCEVFQFELASGQWLWVPFLSVVVRDLPKCHCAVSGCGHKGIIGQPAHPEDPVLVHGVGFYWPHVFHAQDGAIRWMLCTRGNECSGGVDVDAVDSCDGSCMILDTPATREFHFSTGAVFHVHDQEAVALGADKHLPFVHPFGGERLVEIRHEGAWEFPLDESKRLPAFQRSSKIPLGAARLGLALPHVQVFQQWRRKASFRASRGAFWRPVRLAIAVSIAIPSARHVRHLPPH